MRKRRRDEQLEEEMLEGYDDIDQAEGDAGYYEGGAYPPAGEGYDGYDEAHNEAYNDAYDEQLLSEEDAAWDDWDDEGLEEKKYAHSIFRPRTKKPAFIVCVAVNVVRIIFLLIVLVGLAGVGAVAGIAKGYVETAPTLDLAALDEQALEDLIKIIDKVNVK